MPVQLKSKPHKEDEQDRAAKMKEPKSSNHSRTAVNHKKVVVSVGDVTVSKSQHKNRKGTKVAKDLSSFETAAMTLVSHIQKTGWAGIDREFERVCEEEIQDEMQTYKHFSKHPVKNRFMDVVCLDSSRYTLFTGVPPLSDYVHASKVKLDVSERDFVATQAPMDSTIEDFWRLVYDVNPAVIICLHELEVLSGKKGGESFFPLRPNDTTGYGTMVVKNRQMIVNEEKSKEVGYICAQLEVQPEDESAILIKLIQTRDWPDSGTCTSERRNALYTLKAMDAEPRGSVVVHCSGGIGRSASYILLHGLMSKLRKGKPPANLSFMLTELRQQRACSIQNHEQYAIVYVLLLEFLVQNHEPAFGSTAAHLLEAYTAHRK